MSAETKEVTIDELMALSEIEFNAYRRMKSELMTVGHLACFYIENPGRPDLLSKLGQQVGCYRAAEDSWRVAQANVNAAHAARTGGAR